MKRLLYPLAAVALIAILAVALAGMHVKRFLNTPVTVPASGISFEISPGSSFSGISRQLEEASIISNADILRGWARWTGEASAVQAGEYRIAPDTTPIELLEQFTSGAVQLYSFTIVEGWNYRDLLGALHAHPQVSIELGEDDWPAFLIELDAETDWPEGLFLPETYRFPKYTSDRTVLTQAYNLMQKTLQEEWADRADDAPVTSPYETLILASVVEKETARADERPLIAGVFARRLVKRMRLQTDPTVIYGIGPQFNGNLTRRDLRTDTPYNTYTRHGLPPTPIAMPGRAAIHAVLNPADGDALYFVATGLGDGSHKFSANKEEHDAAVREYLIRLRQQRR